MNWYVLYTNPRSEQKTAVQLEKLGLEVYCPLRTEVRQWSDRKKKVTTPLFTSYVFVRLKEVDRYKVFDVPSVVSYLHWLGKPAVVRDTEINVLKEWLNNDSFEEIQVHSLKPGDSIQINGGALKGQKGVIQEVGKKEVKLVLESLGFVVTTRIKDII